MLEIEQLKAELLSIRSGSSSDWKLMCRELREQIHVLEVELYTKQQRSTELTQKTTTVVYQEDPRCAELRAELALLIQQNSRLKQKTT